MEIVCFLISSCVRLLFSLWSGSTPFSPFFFFAAYDREELPLRLKTLLWWLLVVGLWLKLGLWKGNGDGGCSSRDQQRLFNLIACRVKKKHYSNPYPEWLMGWKRLFPRESAFFSSFFSLPVSTLIWARFSSTSRQSLMWNTTSSSKWDCVCVCMRACQDPCTKHNQEQLKIVRRVDEETALSRRVVMCLLRTLISCRNRMSCLLSSVTRRRRSV